MSKLLALLLLVWLVVGLAWAADAENKTDTAVDDKKNGSSEKNANSSLLRAAEFFTDYGFVFDNFYALLNTNKSAITNDTLKDAIHAFAVPVQTYQGAQAGEPVDKLSGSISGLIDTLLVKNGTDNTINDDEWKTNNIWSKVFSKEDLQDVLEKRNGLFNTVASKNSTVDALRKTDRKRLEKYRNATMTLSGDDYTKLVVASDSNQTVDWDLWESRYLTLLTQVVAKNKDSIKPTRKYLAKWLNTGNQDDAAFQKLIVGAQSSKLGRMWSRITKRSGADNLMPITGAMLLALAGTFAAVVAAH